MNPPPKHIKSLSPYFSRKYFAENRAGVKVPANGTEIQTSVFSFSGIFIFENAAFKTSV